MTTSDDVREAVREAYGSRAREVAAEAPGARAAGAKARYYEGADDMPETVVSYGCGSPVAIAGLQPGETVLDLGSGAGLDCFLSAQQVGPTGRVIGLDMTDDMLALAEQNRAKVGATNVEFRRGVIEEIPVEDATVDVIISNCVINLSTDKDAVFSESFRVLRPGGRFQVSDVVLLRDVTEAERADLDLWSGCKSGALMLGDYIGRLQRAGFEDVQVTVTGGEPSAAWTNALVNARRPGAQASQKPWLTSGETIEFLAPAGLATADCCATGETKCC
ncbi:MAG: arsenite methyltransferase [Chloroflexi bacterium]|nr:arsenite methyltransferase [Chloroflexota bacterium]